MDFVLSNLLSINIKDGKENQHFTLIAGPGMFGLKGLLKDNVVSTKRFMIAANVKTEEFHSIVWYGKSMFYFDADLLSGKRGEKD